MADFDVVLIDMGSVFAAAWHSSADDDVSHARSRSVAQIRRLAEGHERVAVCCDSRKNWRKDLAPSYKEQRQPKPEAYYAEMARTEETLKKDGLVVWRAEGFEADDVIATAAAEGVGQGLRVLVHSADKDMLQLVEDESGGERGTVTCCSVRDGKYYRVADVVEKFGVPPKQMRDWLALVGDSSDNVAGIQGVGPKKATALLKAFGSASEALRVALETSFGMESVAKEIGKACTFALKEGAAQLELAQELVSLRTDAPIDFGELFATRAKEPLVEMEPEDMDSDDDLSDVDAVLSPPPSSETQNKAPSQPPPPREQPQRQPETALARVAPAPVGFELELQPRSLNGAFTLAKGLMNSRLYSRFGTEEAIFAVIIRGREMGLGALTALDCFHVVEGKPAMHAHLIVAKAKEHPDCEYFQFIAGDATFAEFETKNRRNPKPTRHRYSLDEAKQAGLCPEIIRQRPQGGDKDRRGNWEKRPADMLRKTCAVQLVRIEYPECALGLYSIEELEGAA